MNEGRKGIKEMGVKGRKERKKGRWKWKTKHEGRKIQLRLGWEGDGYPLLHWQ